MQKLGAVAAIVLGVAGFLYATTASADDTAATNNTMPTKAEPKKPTACTSFWDFLSTDCPLSWYGITVYGTVDAGFTWVSHGAPFDGRSPFGQLYQISKQSNGPRWSLAPNGLSQSNIGIKGNEEITPGWSFVFLVEAGFDPYSLQLTNGPRSVAQNAGVPLGDQSAYGDSSRAGQFYNSQGYFGVSSPTYGTLTVFRQNSLTLDGVLAYDPLGGSYAFSPIGFQGTTCGVGYTEDCRQSTALKYRVNVDPFHIGVFWQFGGYDLNNASNGMYQIEVGGDVKNLGGGTLSLDVIGSYVKDGVSLATSGNTLPAQLPQVLTATISDNTSVMLLSKYNKGPVTLYAGFEWINFAPPSDPQSFFTNISGDFLCLGCADFNNTNINNTAFNAGDKILDIFWTGAKYQVTTDVSVMSGYYHYFQPNFGAPAECGPPNPPSNCSGTFDAVSLAVDWQFAKKFDLYGGMMYTQIFGGLGNGFLNRTNVDPTVGLRFRF
jgi:predicted porin